MGLTCCTMNDLDTNFLPPASVETPSSVEVAHGTPGSGGFLFRRMVSEPHKWYGLKDRPPEGYGFIYSATSPSGKVYVGQTRTSIWWRARQHGYFSNTHRSLLLAATKKYGAVAIRYRCIGCFLVDLLDLAEDTAIRELGTLAPKGYNLKSGGQGPGCGVHSEETRRKMSMTRTGRKYSIAHREAISRGNCGKKITPECRARIAASLRGRHWSAEQRSRPASPAQKRAWRMTGIKARGRTVSSDVRDRISAGLRAYNQVHPRGHRGTSLTVT